jgi:hypothetical protein
MVLTPFSYAVRHGLTKSLSNSDSINLPSRSTGETALSLACQLGDIRAVYDLILVGADRYLAAYDGSLPIHFISMFPPENMKWAAFLLLGSEDSQLPQPAMVRSMESQPRIQTALVKYEYPTAEENELPLTPGEGIIVTNNVDEEWWEGYNAKGESGFFPRMFVVLDDVIDPSLAKGCAQSTEVRIYFPCSVSFPNLYLKTAY